MDIALQGFRNCSFPAINPKPCSNTPSNTSRPPTLALQPAGVVGRLISQEILQFTVIRRVFSSITDQRLKHSF